MTDGADANPTTATGGPTRRRVVFHRSQTEGGSPVLLALCYPPDAATFTAPDEVHELESPQPLPDAGVGALVDVLVPGDGPVWPDTDADVPLLWLRSVERRDHGPGFAEARGGPVVTHPDHAGGISPYAWMGSADDHVEGSAFARFGAWASEARREHRKAWWTVVIATVGLVTYFTARLLGWGNGTGGTGRLWYLGPAIAAAIATIRRMRRRLDTVESRGDLDPETAPRRRLRAEPWWAMTEDRPVELWVTLHDPDDATSPGVVSLPLVDVPRTLDLPADGMVTVIGDAVDGAVVVLELDDPDDRPVTLEPAGACRADVLGPSGPLLP